MEDYVDEVVEGHQIMLESLRGSEMADKGVLYISQWLFASDTTLLQPFYPLSSDGTDSIVRLSRRNYCPNGRTALYDAVAAAADSVIATVQAYKKDGMQSTVRLAIITDGKENDSKRTTERDVQERIRKLRDTEVLESSVVLGLLNSEFTSAMLEQTRRNLGFAQAIELDRTKEREIRRAFVLASKPKRDPRL
jgi:hypothetical protein